MGNCQAAEAATVVVQHPGGKVDRIYWSVTATEIMDSNPGHYVAQVVAAPAPAENGAAAAAVKQVKLLRPSDTLVIGQVYRLVSFEDVLKEFAAKKSVKLGKLLKQIGPSHLEPSSTSQSLSIKTGGSSGGGSGHSGGTNNRGTGRHYGGGGQWRPALHSISELGT